MCSEVFLLTAQQGFPSRTRQTEVAMAQTDAGVRGRTRAPIDKRTMRSDRWWLQPIATFVVFTAFVIYATVGPSRARTTTSSPTSRRSTRPASVTASRALRLRPAFAWWPLSAALIILIFPLGFRLTCYYYRKAYYRAFWLCPRPVPLPSRTRPTAARPGSR